MAMEKIAVKEEYLNLVNELLDQLLEEKTLNTLEPKYKLLTEIEGKNTKWKVVYSPTVVLSMNEKSYLFLVDQMLEYDYQYYTLDKPVVSDKIWDDNYRLLSVLEELHEEWKVPYSSTQRVGGEVLSELPKKVHTTQLYSLDKIHFGEEEKLKPKLLEKVGENEEYSTEWKFDGLTIDLRYENGNYVEGRSRGDGVSGEILTSQISTIKSIPLKIKFKGTVEVHGEGLLSIDGFNRYNERQIELLNEEVKRLGPKANLDLLKNKYKLIKNVRNGAAGSLRQLDPKETAKRPLDAIFYNINYIEGAEIHSQEEVIEFLIDNGFKVSPDFTIVHNYEEMVEVIKKFNKKRSKLNFEVDGIVFKANDFKIREKLGYTNKHPRFALAYKFEAVEENSTLNKVTWQVGRTGQVTPVGWIEPIEIGGVTVNKATLSNLSVILAKNLSLGCDVIVRRAGDVIPEIRGAVEGSEGSPIVPPTHCPSCGSKLVTDWPFLKCTNHEECPAQQLRKWAHYGSREALDINTFSDKTAEKLNDAGLLNCLQDLYRLPKEGVAQLEGFGDKSAEKLLKAIEKSKHCEWKKFLFALGINSVGEGTSKRLANVFHSWDELKQATVSDLMSVDDIGVETAPIIYNWIQNPLNQALINELFELGVRPTHKSEVEGSKLGGKTFVITGSFQLHQRKEYKEMIEKNGGKVTGSVSKKTDFLLAGDKPGSKLTDAENLEIEIINEQQLLDKLS